MISLDSETCLITPGCLAPPLVCVTVAWDDAPSGDPGIYHRQDSQLKVLLENILDPDDAPCSLVGHNIAYDMAVLANTWPDLMPLIFEAYEKDRITDTMLREKLQHIALGVYRGQQQGDVFVKFGYSLASVAERRLGVKLDKTTYRLNYGALINTPLAEWPAGARQYAIDDAVTTLNVWRDQEGEGKELLQDEYRQARAAWWLHLTSCWGLKTDARYVQRFKQQVEDELADVERTLKAAGLVRKNGVRDTKAAGKVVMDAYNAAGKTVPFTEKGSIRLDSGVCEESGHPLLKAYAAFSSLKKKLSTDVPLLLSGVSTPIQARFETLLETGRTSSSPNIQNLPRKGGMRECFAPRPGYVYASADYGQIELRTVAQVCMAVFGRSRLAEALNAGLDPHLEMACRIVGCSYEEGLRRREAGDEDIDNARQTAKVANFGFPGGLGILRFIEFAKKSYDVVLTERQAAELKRVWLETWPEFVEYFKWVGSQCEQPGAVVEQLYVGRRRGNVSFTEASNGYFQGLAADLMKAAGFLVAKACYVEQGSPLYGSRICNMVHDELIIETPEEGAAEAAEELARLMVAGAAPFLPDVPAIAEPVLMRQWSKKAKAVRDVAGRLTVWEAAA